MKRPQEKLAVTFLSIGWLLVAVVCYGIAWQLAVFYIAVSFWFLGIFFAKEQIEKDEKDEAVKHAAAVNAGEKRV